MKNLTKKIKDFFYKSSIKFHVENRNYEIAEKIAKKNPIFKNYLLDIYNEKGLNLLACDFYNHSC